MKKHPCEGSCWYCYDDSEPILFSCEFDTYIHEHCIRKQPLDDTEARIFRIEFEIENVQDL